MIINWTKQGLKTISIKAANKASKIKKTVKLLPGFNEVPDDEWKEIKQNPMIQKQIELGIIVEVAEKKEVKKKVKNGKGEEIEKTVVESGKAKQLKDLDAEAVVAMVEDTFDVDLLKKWKKEESRDEIRAAIANQLEKILKGGNSK